LADINGVLLEDGTVLKVPPPEVSRFNALFAPGQAIAALGIERVNVAGKVVEVTAIGASPEHLQSIPSGASRPDVAANSR
jgi:hypothetical protein